MTPRTHVGFTRRLAPGVRWVGVVRSRGERAGGRAARGSRRSRAAVLVGVVMFLAVQVALNVVIRNEWLPVRDPVYAEKTELLELHPGFFDGPGRATPHPNPTPQRG